MILVDTSVWVDHLRAGNDGLTALLTRGEVLGHPFVMGELALGNLRRRDAVLSDLRDLPQAVVASDEEVLVLHRSPNAVRARHRVCRRPFAGRARLTAAAKLWTRDRRLQAVAVALSLAATLSH